MICASASVSTCNVFELKLAYFHLITIRNMTKDMNNKSAMGILLTCVVVAQIGVAVVLRLVFFAYLDIVDVKP